MVAAAASYASLFVLLLVESLQGRSVVAPDATTLAAIAIWVVATALALSLIAVGSRGAARDGMNRMAV